jgi:hypothetical protein
MPGITSTTDLDYLIPSLRWKLGDIDSTNYRYLDEWLRVALVSALKILQRWWGVRYLIDETTYVVSRYDESDFQLEAPPVIQQLDEEVIVIMATILTREGTLENSAWSAGSWRDAEVSVSNIEGSRIREAGIQRLWNELLSYLTPPTKRLMGIYRTSIPGADEYGL